MDPAKFTIDDPLSAWLECFLEVRCSCERVTLVPVRLLIARRRNPSFRELVGRLRCGRCGARPASVYLCETHFRHSRGLGVQAGWSIELVPAR